MLPFLTPAGTGWPAAMAILLAETTGGFSPANDQRQAVRCAEVSTLNLPRLRLRLRLCPAPCRPAASCLSPALHCPSRRSLGTPRAWIEEGLLEDEAGLAAEAPARSPAAASARGSRQSLGRPRAALCGLPRRGGGLMRSILEPTVTSDDPP